MAHAPNSGAYSTTSHSQIQLLPKAAGFYYVKLTLPDGSHRGIGEIDSIDGTYRKTIQSKDHFFRLNGEVGLNYELLADPRFAFQSIEIRLDGELLTIDRTDALRFGHKRTFPGFESQLFIPLKFFNSPEIGRPEPHSLGCVAQLSFDFGEREK